MGQARPGVAMTTDTIMPWMSCTKPVVAQAVGLVWQRGLLDLDDRVARHIPEFGANGKDAVTVRHLLTHTGGFRVLTGDFVNASWDQIIAAICDMKLEPGWAPGQKAGYHTRTSWYILAEIVRRLDGRDIQTFAREEIFDKLEMRDSWVCMTSDAYDACGERIGYLISTEANTSNVDLADSTCRLATSCVPGASGRGPMRELARFYETLLARGMFNDHHIASPQTIEAMTARQRTAMYDHTFKFVCDWGLGFKLDSKVHGKVFEPYGFGAHASPRAFGHGGAESSISFADPHHGLAVALVFNGMPGERAHQHRNHEVLTALYEDLGLAAR
jgi:CubicO group peptidase (beta-lactamase class C family)